MKFKDVPNNGKFILDGIEYTSKFYPAMTRSFAIHKEHYISKWITGETEVQFINDGPLILEHLVCISQYSTHIFDDYIPALVYYNDHGKPHRLDGYAIAFANGINEWFVNGYKYDSEFEYWIAVQKYIDMHQIA